MVPSSRLLTGLDKHTAADLRKQFGKRITDGCGKSFACRNICPAGIDIERLMARSKARTVICKEIDSLRSQFFHKCRYFSSHPNERSTIHPSAYIFFFIVAGMTTEKVYSSIIVPHFH